MFGDAFLVRPVTRPLFDFLPDEGNVIAPEFFVNEAGEISGITGHYFKGMNFEEEVNVKTDTQIDFNFDGAPPTKLGETQYSIRWKGFVKAPESGEYIFSTSADDGVRLKVNGELLIDRFAIDMHGKEFARVELEKGAIVPLELEFMQGWGRAKVKLSWALPHSKEAAEKGRSDRTIKTRLPAGTEWIDFYTGERLAGGQVLEREGVMERMPLFVKAGSIVPMGPYVQYIAEKAVDPLEVRIYPGQDGEFVLYEDEGDNYRYEEGVYSEIPFTWDDEAKTLKIGARKGTFPGMLVKRTIKVVIVKEGHGVEIAPVATPDAEVSYSGKPLELTF